MEMNSDIFTPDLPIPELVEFEDAPIPAPVEEEKPAETPPPRRRRKADAPVLTIESGDENRNRGCPRSCCLARNSQRLPHTAHPLRTVGRYRADRQRQDDCRCGLQRLPHRHSSQRNDGRPERCQQYRQHGRPPDEAVGQYAGCGN